MRSIQRGITLVELLVVLGVIAALSMAFVLRMAAARATAAEDAAKATASSLASAVSSFYLANGCYPREVTVGALHSGMGPYVGGQWPADMDYEQRASFGGNPSCPANCIGISWRVGGNDRWTVWVTQGVAVPICP